MGGTSQLRYATKSLKLLRLLRLAKLFRLLRVNRIFRYVRFAKSYLEDRFKIHIPFTGIKIMRLLAIVFLISHVMGCINWYICRLYDFPPESWVSQFRLAEKDGMTQYGWTIVSRRLHSLKSTV